ncbi:MAG: transpeptidase family protein [Chlorobi bacterium]|nr:transpeptidase family protein [Chlorobiota bacterium]
MNNSRALIILILFTAAFIFIGSRLFTVQIIKHDYYVKLARSQQQGKKIVKAQRGIIKDRDGSVLAYSKDDITFSVDTRMTDEAERRMIASKFASVFNGDSSKYFSLMNAKRGNVCLAKKVSLIDALLLEGYNPDCLIRDEELSRIYPYGRLASHLLGFTNYEVKGVAGIERNCDEELSGKNGEIYFEYNGKGEIIGVNEDISVKPLNGAIVELTIDKTYQTILEEELYAGIAAQQAESGVGIIMNPQTGEILAMANYPTYDPNNLKNSDNDSRRNRAVSDTYEPGSTMKPIIMSALLDKNLVREDEVINTENGVYRIKNTPIKDAHPYRKLTVREIIEHSSNIGISKLSDRLSGKELYKHLRDFGFGQITSVDLPSEAPGFLKKPSQYSALSKAYISFGYEISVSPLQMAAAYSALINGGILYKPYAVKQIVGAEGNLIKKNVPLKIRRVIKQSTSETIKSFMQGVIENGTAQKARLTCVMAGGKTGTTQQLIGGAYSGKKFNSSFVGFFPVENPTTLILIYIHSPKKKYYGGDVCAPVFKNIAERLIEADIKIVPQKCRIKRDDKFVNQIVKNIKQNEELNDEFLTLNVPDPSDEKKETEPVEDARTSIPNLLEKTKREAIAVVSNLGVNFKVFGTGNVVSQSIKAGEPIEKGRLLILRCKPANKLKGLRIN